jgi:serine/threonine protein kinase
MMLERPSFQSMFVRQETLGEGAFAVVFRATNRNTGQTYAIKDVSGGNSEELQNEIQTLLYLNGCPYIVELYNVFYEERHTYLVMEEMRGGDLLDKIVEKECYPEDEARQVCQHLFEALDFCHKNRVAHRDLKPENLLLVERDNDVMIKLADFGLAASVTKPNCLRTLCGTTEYAAPEVFSGQGYDHRADMWSAGVIMYVLLGGYAPFEGALDELLYVIQNGIYKFHDDCWCGVSSAAKRMIRCLLCLDPTDRMSAREALESDWMTMEDHQLSCRDLCLQELKDIVPNNNGGKLRRSLQRKGPLNKVMAEFLLVSHGSLSPSCTLRRTVALRRGSCGTTTNYQPHATQPTLKPQINRALTNLLFERRVPRTHSWNLDSSDHQPSIRSYLEDEEDSL